jgi:hypothetical protein
MVIVLMAIVVILLMAMVDMGAYWCYYISGYWWLLY